MSINYVWPGIGIGPDMADMITKKRFTKELMAGTLLDWGDFKNSHGLTRNINQVDSGDQNVRA